MRHVIYILTLLILVSCSNKKEQKKNDYETTPENKIATKATIIIDTVQIDACFDELKIWLNYYEQYSIELEDFEFVNQENLPNITAEIDAIQTNNDIYEPYYKYSKDSSKILDLISYNLALEKNEKNEIVSFGGSIDSEVSIKDLKNKVWKRVLFVGPFYIIEDGFWINNDQILIVGEYNNTEENEFKPSIWYIDLKTNIIQTFEYKNYIKKMNCNYLENVRYKGVKTAK